jgi:hypothetical protein
MQLSQALSLVIKRKTYAFEVNSAVPNTLAFTTIRVVNDIKDLDFSAVKSGDMFYVSSTREIYMRTSNEVFKVTGGVEY